MNICKAEALQPAGGQDYILGRETWEDGCPTFPHKPERSPWELAVNCLAGGMALVRSQAKSPQVQGAGGRGPMRCSYPRRQVGAALEGELWLVVLIGFFKRAPSRPQRGVCPF